MWRLVVRARTFRWLVGANENRRVRRLDFGVACAAVATLEIYRACFEQERKAVHDSIYCLGGNFVRSWMFNCILDSLKALQFLISWSGTEVNQAFQITKYISLVTLMILAFGVGFLSPLLIVFLQLVGVLTPRTLIKQWRYAIVAIFFMAAIITPSGDPITLLALGLPLTVMYFIAILIGFLVIRRRGVTSN